jgi:dTMP kinase
MEDVVRMARGLGRRSQQAVLSLASTPNGDVIVQRNARAELTKLGIVAPSGRDRYRLTGLGERVAKALRPLRGVRSIMEEGSARGERPRGRFIVFEGVDGSGKSTQARLLYERLQGLDRKSPYPLGLLIANPSKGPIGQMVREYLLGIKETEDWKALACLFAADMRDRMPTVERSLAAGVDVVCDRHTLSTLVYQGAMARTPEEEAWVARLHDGVRKPDVTFILHLNVAEALRRAKARGRKEIFKSKEWLPKLINRYANTDVSRVVHIDAGAPIEEVAATVWGVVEALSCAS